MGAGEVETRAQKERILGESQRKKKGRLAFSGEKPRRQNLRVSAGGGQRKGDTELW